MFFKLFGYGDDPNPYTETVDTLEDLVLEFITDMTQRAMDIGRPGRVQVHHAAHILLHKHDKNLYFRIVKHITTLNPVIRTVS